LLLNEVPLAMTDNVKILGVTLDSNLSMNKFVSDTVRSCNFHIRAFCHIRPHLTKKAAIMIVCSIMIIAIPYCMELPFKIYHGYNRFKIVLLVLCVRLLIIVMHHHYFTPFIGYLLNAV